MRAPLADLVALDDRGRVLRSRWVPVVPVSVGGQRVVWFVSWGVGVAGRGLVVIVGA